MKRPSIDFWEIESKQVDQLEAGENLAKFTELCKELKVKMRLIEAAKKKGNSAEVDWLKVCNILQQKC